jgi:hypothetical protein
MGALALGRCCMLLLAMHNRVRITRAGEYGLMGLLALGMCYVLLLANGNAEFGAGLGGNGAAVRPPWPQPRLDVPGWAALHAAFAERLHSGAAAPVRGSLACNLYLQQGSVGSSEEQMDKPHADVATAMLSTPSSSWMSPRLPIKGAWVQALQRWSWGLLPCVSVRHARGPFSSVQAYCWGCPGVLVDKENDSLLRG